MGSSPASSPSSPCFPRTVFSWAAGAAIRLVFLGSGHSCAPELLTWGDSVIAACGFVCGVGAVRDSFLGCLRITGLFPRAPCSPPRSTDTLGLVADGSPAPNRPCWVRLGAGLASAQGALPFADDRPHDLSPIATCRRVHARRDARSWCRRRRRSACRAARAAFNLSAHFHHQIPHLTLFFLHH